MVFRDYSLSKILRQRNHTSDYVVPACMAVLLMFSVAFIFSAQSFIADDIPLMRQFWVKQIMYYALGIVVYLLLSYFDYNWLFKNAHLIYIAFLLPLLPLVLKEVFGVPVPFVQSRYNATRWIDFGFFSIQPSDFAKIGTCVMASSMFARNKLGTFKENFLFWIKLALVYLIPIFLIFLQPDLGSSLVFYPMIFSMLYISGLPKRFFLTMFAVFAIIVSLVVFDIYGYYNYLKENNLTARDSASQNAYGSSGKWNLPMKDYQRNRILAFVCPDVVDKNGTEVTWNQRQSLISVGSGGVFGKGFAEGTQARLGYLPSSVAYNDFIFSVVAEESGFAGGCIVIVLLGTIVVYGCVRAAQLSRDRFGQFMCIGIASILLTHTFINVGMTIGIMPITGLPLPMLSYGGTFALTCCILLGIVQSVFRYRRKFEE